MRAEVLQNIDEYVTCQVLAGNDMDLLSADLEIARATKFVGALEKRKRMGQESAAVGRENCGETRSAALPIQLDAELGFKRNQPVPHALLGNAKGVGRRPNLSHARQFYERGDLVRAEMGQGGHEPRQYNQSDYESKN